MVMRSLARDWTKEDLPDPEGPMSRITNAPCGLDILLGLSSRRVGWILESLVVVGALEHEKRYPMRTHVVRTGTMLSGARRRAQEFRGCQDECSPNQLRTGSVPGGHLCGEDSMESQRTRFFFFNVGHANERAAGGFASRSAIGPDGSNEVGGLRVGLGSLSQRGWMMPNAAPPEVAGICKLKLAQRYF